MGSVDGSESGDSKDKEGGGSNDDEDGGVGECEPMPLTPHKALQIHIIA